MKIDVIFLIFVPNIESNILNWDRSNECNLFFYKPKQKEQRAHEFANMMGTYYCFSGRKFFQKAISMISGSSKTRK